MSSSSSLEGLAAVASVARPAKASNKKATKAASETTAKTGRGTGYSRTEDILISKAFAAASEDPIVGNNMVTAAFKNKMYDAYVCLLTQQEKLDEMRFATAAGASSTKAAGVQPYPRRNVSAVSDRFKGTISPRVMKIIGVEKTTTMESGWKKEDFFNACKVSYEMRYPRMGKFEDFYPCKEYLEGKPKFNEFHRVTNPSDGDSKQPQRPAGQKKEKQAKAAKEVVKAVVEEIDRGKDTNPTSTKYIDDFYGKAGSALECLVSQFQQQNEMKMFETLSTPQKRTLQQVCFETMLAEANAKKAAAEQEYKRVKHPKIPSNVNLVADKASTNRSSEGSSCSNETHSSEEII